MISACYSMELYCDCLACQAAPRRNYVPDSEYTGETWGECARQARKDGWYISRDRTTAIKPGHKKG